jgi:hypothetical protein
MIRKPWLWAVVLGTAALLGCGTKPEKKNGEPDSAPPPAAGTSQPIGVPGPSNTEPKYVSSAGGNNPVNPNQNGNLTVKGGEGIQSPRMAAARTINNAQLKQLHLSMFQTFQLDNRVPDINEVMNEAKQNRQLLPLLQEEVVILTGTKLGSGVWAYSQYPQRNGNHYVVTTEGVSEMSPTDLKNRLTQEKSPIKMSQ